MLRRRRRRVYRHLRILPSGPRASGSTEAKDTGAAMIVTSCPWCESNLRAGGIGMEEKMEIENLFDLMMEAL